MHDVCVDLKCKVHSIEYRFNAEMMLWIEIVYRDAYIWITFPKSAKHHTLAQSLNKLLYLDVLRAYSRIDAQVCVIEEARFNLMCTLDLQVRFHSAGNNAKMSFLTINDKRNARNASLYMKEKTERPWNGRKKMCGEGGIMKHAFDFLSIYLKKKA